MFICLFIRDYLFHSTFKISNLREAVLSVEKCYYLLVLVKYQSVRKSSNTAILFSKPKIASESLACTIRSVTAEEERSSKSGSIKPLNQANRKLHFVALS